MSGEGGQRWRAVPHLESVPRPDAGAETVYPSLEGIPLQGGCRCPLRHETPPAHRVAGRGGGSRDRDVRVLEHAQVRDAGVYSGTAPVGEFAGRLDRLLFAASRWNL